MESLTACSRNMSSSKSKKRSSSEVEESVDMADSAKVGMKNSKNHFPKCPENPNNQSKQTQSQLVSEKDQNNEGEARLKAWALNPHEARESIAKMIIIDELPFRFVENVGFRLMMSVCCPSLNMPSRITIARDIYHIYVNERVKLKEYLTHSCQMVCVTIDTWTSLQRINYMVITAHFIDNDWKLHKKILNICAISSHKGDDIALVLGKCLEDWGLTSKLYTITVDNAGSNSSACSALIGEFNRHGHFLFSGGEFLHVKCVVHILNLVVWDALKVVGKSVKRVRAAVRFIRQSPRRLQRFQECAIAEKIESKAALFLDVPTRWNSTFKMLSTALVYERVFTKYSERDPYYNVELAKDDDADRPPNSDDWKQVKYLLVFLEVFYNVTLRLSGTSYVTSNMLLFDIVDIHIMLKHLEQVVETIDANYEEIEEIKDIGSRVTNFKEMAKTMRMKYDKYNGTPEEMNPLVYIAPIFDPRYKLAGLEISLCELFGETQGSAIVLKVREKLESLFDEYWQLYKPLATQSEQRIGAQPEVQKGNAFSGAAFYIQRLRKKLKGPDGGKRIIKTELQKYLNEGLEEDEVGDDVLGWWKVHGPRYPVIARMARDILAVPASTVALDSAFSVGGRTLDSFRTCLTPKMVQALICAQDWLRPSSSLDMDDYFDELRDLDKDLGKLSLKDNVIDGGDTLNI